MKNSRHGIIALVISTFIYGLYGVYIRLLGDFFHTFSQAYTRSLMILVIWLIYFLFNKNKWVKIDKKDIKVLILWSCIGISTTLLFPAINNLQIGTVYFLIYSTMIISGVLFGKILFKEKLNKIKIASLLLSLFGLLIIYSVEVSIGKLFFLSMALVSGALVGLGNVVPKLIDDKYSIQQLQVVSMIGVTIINFISSMIAKEPFPQFVFHIAWFWNLMFAISTIGALGFIIYAFKNLEAQIATLIMPIEVIFASLFGFVLFNEVLTIKVLAGGLLIFMSAALPGFIKTKK